MRVVCITKSGRDFSREVDEWLEMFARRTGKEIEMIDPDSPAGGSFMRVYDVVEYPTLLALDDRGAVLAAWRGLPMPRFDEVSYYAK